MSVLDSIQGMVTPGLIDSLGQKFGLSPARLGASMGGLAGTVMSGLAGRASDRSAMDSLAGLVNESPNEPEDFDRLADAPDDSPMKRRGNQLLELATGGNPSRMAGGIGSMLGLGGGAAGGLLGAVAALAIGAMRKLGRTRRLDSSSLGSLLQSESTSYREAIPSSWRGHMPDLEQAHLPVGTPRRSKLPLVAIAVAILAFLGLRYWRRTHDEERSRRPTTSQTYQPSQREARPGPQQGHSRMGEPSPAQQPGGTAESKLLSEVRSPHRTGRPIPLDKVTFATGSSTLEPASDAQLSRVARVLERNPQVHVNVAGYADQGAASDETLSRARAASVRDALVEKGVAGARIQVATGREAASAAGRETAFGQVSIRVIPEDDRG
jgi:outer membrane protein OmpA-like peptidoglycan-associated protein